MNNDTSEIEKVFKKRKRKNDRIKDTYLSNLCIL